MFNIKPSVYLLILFFGKRVIFNEKVECFIPLCEEEVEKIALENNVGEYTNWECNYYCETEELDEEN